LGPSRASRRRYWQGNGEFTPLPQLAGNGQLTAHQPNVPLADGQTQPAPLA